VKAPNSCMNCRNSSATVSELSIHNSLSNTGLYVFSLIAQSRSAKIVLSTSIHVLTSLCKYVAEPDGTSFNYNEISSIFSLEDTTQ
jgi:hypothetical protein